MKSRLRRKDNLERQNKKLPMNFYSLWNIKNIASIINNAVILLRKTFTTTAALNLEFFLMQDQKLVSRKKEKLAEIWIFENDRFFDLLLSITVTIQQHIFLGFFNEYM